VEQVATGKGHLVREDLVPYEFDGPYAQCLSDPRTAMDRRHIYMMHDILMAHPFRNCLEIGSYRGASATAFVEAMNKVARMFTTFCDVNITDGLCEVLWNCKDKHRARTTSNPSWSVLDSAEDFDFILVDGCHDLASVTKELERLVIRRPLCVMAHDTNATAAGYPLAEGAEYLKRVFKSMYGYGCLEDKANREGEETHRGLFFATTSEELYRKAQHIFARWNTWTTDSQKCIGATT
jgi:predicted O-methyltransferase YrrM